MSWIVSNSYKRNIKKLISDDMIIATTSILANYFNKNEHISKENWEKKPYITALQKTGIFEDDFILPLVKLDSKFSSYVTRENDLFTFITYLRLFQRTDCKITAYKDDLNDMLSRMEYFLHDLKN